MANGGTNAWFWWLLLGMLEPTPEPSFRMIADTMRRTVGDLLAASEREGITPRRAAEAVAEKVLDDLEREYALY